MTNQAIPAEYLAALEPIQHYLEAHRTGRAEYVLLESFGVAHRMAPLWLRHTGCPSALSASTARTPLHRLVMLSSYLSECQRPRTLVAGTGGSLDLGESIRSVFQSPFVSLARTFRETSSCDA